MADLIFFLLALYWRTSKTLATSLSESLTHFFNACFFTNFTAIVQVFGLICPQTTSIGVKCQCHSRSRFVVLWGLKNIVFHSAETNSADKGDFEHFQSSIECSLNNAMII